MRNRREFIPLLGGAAAAWPLAARAQQPAPPVIGFMSSRSADDSAYLIEAFRQSLREAGLVEGQNVAIEFRWAGGQYDRLPALAAELVRRPVSVLIAVGGDPAVFAAKAATSTIPVVFGMGSDPVKLGLVASLNRPGGNITGIAIWTDQLEPKRLGLLHELMPKAKMIGVLLNPNFAPAVRASQEIRKAAETIGQQITIANAATPTELDAAFARLVAQRAEALLVGADPFFDTQRNQIIALAAQYRMPAFYQFREYAVAGGLISYGIDLADAYRQYGAYAARILKGANPADLPVMQSVKFEFVTNLQAAKALGLEILPTLSARADEVIE